MSHLPVFSEPHLLVFGFIRIQEKITKLTKLISDDVKHLIHAFYPKTYQILTDNQTKNKLTDSLNLLRIAYDDETRNIYLSGKKSSTQHNINQIYNPSLSTADEWMDFTNKPPYYWKIQSLVNPEDGKHFIAIVKDNDVNIRYFTFNKHTLEWNRSVNQILLSCDCLDDPMDETVSIMVENCIFIKEYSYLLLLLSKETDSLTDIFEVIVYEIDNILKPKFVMKQEFRLDYTRYNVIKHPLFFDKIILFGGTSRNVREPQPFIDTFMVIHIDKKSMTICDDTDFDFETQFGAEAVDEVLTNAFLGNDKCESEFCVTPSWELYHDVEYLAFSHCVIGHQLFLFGGYCQRKLLHSVIVYDFMDNEWSLSNAMIPKEILKSRVVLDTHQNNLHLFAMRDLKINLKRDYTYKYHYVFKLKQGC